MDFAVPHRLGSAVIEPDDGLSPCGATGGAAPRRRSDGCIVKAAVGLGIVEGVDQRHPGQPYGEALGGLDLHLRQLRRAALFDVQTLLDRLRGRRGGGWPHLLLQLANLLPQFAVFAFQAIEPLEDLLNIRRRLRLPPEERGQQRKDQLKAMAVNSHAIAAPACPARRRANRVWRSKRPPPAGEPAPASPGPSRRSPR